MMKRSGRALASLIPLLFITPTFGATITYTAAQPTTFVTPGVLHTASVALPLFDPSLGALTRMTLTLTGDSFHDFSLENFGATPGTVNFSISAQMAASAPGGLNPTVTPTLDGSRFLPAYDGLLDFGGSRGQHSFGQTGASDSSFRTDAGVLALYTGLGNFSTGLSAKITKFDIRAEPTHYQSQQ